MLVRYTEQDIIQFKSTIEVLNTEVYNQQQTIMLASKDIDDKIDIIKEQQEQLKLYKEIILNNIEFINYLKEQNKKLLEQKSYQDNNI